MVSQRVSFSTRGLFRGGEDVYPWLMNGRAGVVFLEEPIASQRPGEVLGPGLVGSVNGDFVSVEELLKADRRLGTALVILDGLRRLLEKGDDGYLVMDFLRRALRRELAVCPTANAVPPE